MVIQLAQLARYQPLEKVVIHSLESSLYQVSVLINGIEHLIYKDETNRLTAASPQQIHTLFSGYEWQEMVVRQSGAYDEMIGLPAEPHHGLEVPLSRHKLE